ncbi:MAG TPA: phosphoribosylpyrophosphate synthetase [Anseongella sp.]
MNSLSTLTEVLAQLKAEGYTTDFNLQDNCITCHGNALQLHPDDFIVDKYFRFEGASDPDDQAILYAISSPTHQLKGVLVNGYGIYSDDKNDKIMAALHEKTRNL